jgi:hypothetical protein
MGRQAMDEMLFPASDYGVLPRTAKALTGNKKEEK